MTKPGEIRLIRSAALSIGMMGLLMLALPAAHSATVDITVVDAAGIAVEDAVAYLVPAVAPVAAAHAKAIMDQRGLKFVPHVLPLQVGTAVEFPNGDQVRHHVYSFSPPKKFELRLYKDTPTEPVVFDKVGVVTLGCNIHDWMLGYIVVVDTPYFASSDAQGKAAIADVPAGDYTLKLWHARQHGAAEATQPLHVDAAGKSTRVSLTLGPADPDPEPPTELEQKFRKYQKKLDGT